MKRFSMALALAALVCGTLAAQEKKNYPPSLEGATVEVYKNVGDVSLNMYIYSPEGHKASDRRPAIVFFFGGGWRAGSPAQFQEHCKYLASRGMVAMTADYRVSSRHNTKAVNCVADGKSAVRWIRAHAARLGVDPERVAAGGGSAGGHVAACTGTISKFDESSEDATVSSRPNAMVLFNPAVVLAPIEGKNLLDEEKQKDLRERMGVEPSELSPFHQVGKGVPPTIIFHGTADTAVPFTTVELFTAAMKKAGNRCRLVGYEGQPHGFFNFSRKEGKYTETVRAMDRFLVSLGYLAGKTAVDKNK